MMELERKRMSIIQQIPSLSDFYEYYLTKKAKKSKQERDFEAFISKYPKRFEGFNQYLHMPERKIIHKNKRFVRFDDLDMGEEVEAAIYNDGKHAPDELRRYINHQMSKIMTTKMNEQNIKLKSEDYDSSLKRKLNIDELIDKNQMLLNTG